MDATDYLNTSEARRQIDLARDLVMQDVKDHPEKYRNSLGHEDPNRVEQEANRQILSAKEEMMYDLPDEYLEPLELEGRGQRRAESGWPEHAAWGIEINDENEQ